MRLNFPVPSEWPQRQVSGQRVAIVPGADKADVLVAWGGLILLPDEQNPWVRRAMSVESNGGRIEVTDDVTLETEAGWPVRLVRATVSGPGDGDIVEWRLGAFYAFFEHAGSALMRATDKARFDAVVGQVEHVMRRATPDWTGEVAALTQLWDLSETPAPESAGPPAPDVPPAPGPVTPKVPEAERVAAWRKAADADSPDVDALYNLGQYHYNEGDYEAALASWTRADEVEPGDFWTLRKLVQANYALSRFDAAAEVRNRLLTAWKSASSERVKLTDEYVFDQFRIEDVAVFAFEALRPTGTMAHTVLSFRAVFEDQRQPPLSVQVETSELARSRGTPYVLSVIDGKNYRVVGANKAIPPYPALRQTVRDLLTAALVQRATPA